MQLAWRRGPARLKSGASSPAQPASCLAIPLGNHRQRTSESGACERPAAMPVTPQVSTPPRPWVVNEAPKTCASGAYPGHMMPLAVRASGSFPLPQHCNACAHGPRVHRSWQSSSPCAAGGGPASKEETIAGVRPSNPSNFNICRQGQAAAFAGGGAPGGWCLCLAPGLHICLASNLCRACHAEKRIVM